MLTPQDLKYYVVCLTNRADRVANVTESRKVIPQMEIIEAVDGNKMTVDDIRDWQKKGYLPEDHRLYDHMIVAPLRGRKLKMGEIGAFLSHCKALEAIANGDAPGGVVFEDDAIPLPGFMTNLATILNVLRPYTDFVHLFVSHSHKKFFSKEPRLYTAPNGLHGMVCYFVTKEGAKYALKRMKPQCGAVDETITRIGLNSYVVGGIEFVKNVGLMGHATFDPSKTTYAQLAKYAVDILGVDHGFGEDPEKEIHTTFSKTM